NGVLDPGEECEEDTEEARANDEDGCTRYCLICGNNVTTPPGETCDDGNHVGGDGCSARCTTEACGNHVVDVGETCDDGNTVDDDGKVMPPDSWPADCTLDVCTPISASVRGATVSWNAPVSVGSLTVLLDYPEGKVSLPGSGGSVPAGGLLRVPHGAASPAHRRA